MKTCVPSLSELVAPDIMGTDRKFQVTGGGTAFTITEVADIDGVGGECTTAEVTLVSDGNTFYFTNRAEEDCLVTVIIT